MFKTLRKSKTPINIRIIIGIGIVVVYGFIGYLIVKVVSSELRYSTHYYILVLIYEFLYALKPFLIGLIPAIFIALLYIFQKTSVKKLLLISVLIGLVYASPAFIHNMSNWSKSIEIIQGVPVENVSYERYLPGVGIWNEPHSIIRFTIPNKSVSVMRNTIEQRIQQQNNTALHFFLEVDFTSAYGFPLNPYRMDLTQYSGVIRGEIYTNSK